LAAPDDAHGFEDPFRPLRAASGPKVIAALVFGPTLWLVALLLVSVVLDRTNAVELGLLIAAASFVFAAVVLSLLRLGRSREERRYADRA
jgi:MFS superfamily sulfate permease-like transporter